MFKFIEETLYNPIFSMNGAIMIAALFAIGIFIHLVWFGTLAPIVGNKIKIAGSIPGTNTYDPLELSSGFFWAGMLTLFAIGFRTDDVVWMITKGTAVLEYPEGQPPAIWLLWSASWFVIGMVALRALYLLAKTRLISAVIALALELPVFIWAYATGLFAGPIILFIGLTRTFEGSLPINPLTAIGGAIMMVVDIGRRVRGLFAWATGKGYSKKWGYTQNYIPDDIETEEEFDRWAENNKRLPLEAKPFYVQRKEQKWAYGRQVAEQRKAASKGRPK